ncbi:MAG: CoA transferase, partial [Orrella sp.]
IHNFRPGVMARLGLDYESLVKQVPNLVYLSISGYGPDGPYAALPASDSVMQADSGLMYMNRTPEDQPQRVGMLMADVVTGLYAAQALSAALYRRQSTGEGLHIQTSLFESCLAFQAMGLLEHSMVGAKPVGAVSAPNGVFDTADGQLTVVVLNDEQFARFCRAIDRETWLEDPSLATNALRMQARARLQADVQAILRQASSEDWVKTFTTHDILHARVRDYDSLKAHPQVAHLGVLQPVVQPLVGELLRVASPIEAFRHEGQTAPLIGEHSVAVLRSLGFDQARIDQWLVDGVVKQAP